MRRIILITIFSTLVLSVNLSVAAERVDFENPSYLFHLYYDNDQLFADRDYELKYDVIPETFVAEQLSTQFPFRGEVITFLNEVAAEFQFDPRGGNPSFLKGKISVKAPYAPDGQKVIFYDYQDRQLLTVFVSESSFCNDDGVCSPEKGEDQNTCFADCRGVTPAPPSTDSRGGQSSLLAALVYALIAIGVISGGWFGWKWFSKKRKPSITDGPANFPPPMPPSVQ